MHALRSDNVSLGRFDWVSASTTLSEYIPHSEPFQSELEVIGYILELLIRDEGLPFHPHDFDWPTLHEQASIALELKLEGPSRINLHTLGDRILPQQLASVYTEATEIINEYLGRPHATDPAVKSSMFQDCVLGSTFATGSLECIPLPQRLTEYSMRVIACIFLNSLLMMKGLEGMLRDWRNLRPANTSRCQPKLDDVWDRLGGLFSNIFKFFIEDGISAIVDIAVLQARLLGQDPVGESQNEGIVSTKSITRRRSMSGAVPLLQSKRDVPVSHNTRMRSLPPL